MPKVTVYCDHCGEPVEKQSCHVKRVKHHFCNTTCYGAWRSENIRGANVYSWKGGPPTVPCDFCGNPVTLRCTAELELYERHFCNRKCHSAWCSENRTGANSFTWAGGPVTVACDWCGTPVDKPARFVERCKHHFCNQECSASWTSANKSGENSPAWKGGKVTVQCDQCGAQLERYPSLVRPRNFCNRSCAGDWCSANLVGPDSTNWNGGPVAVQCNWCGKTVEKAQSTVKEHNFCNLGCFNAWRSENLVGENCAAWRGGLSFAPYHPNFNEAFKQTIRQRDNHACQLCTEPGNHVHHIYYDKLNDCQNPKDFIALCPSCHSSTNANRPHWIKVLEAKIAAFYPILQEGI